MRTRWLIAAAAGTWLLAGTASAETIELAQAGAGPRAQPPAAQAQRDLPIRAFFGTFRGSGIAQNEDSLYFNVTIRDLDLRIVGAGKGFTATWTTVLRQGGDPARPNVRKRTATLTFAPTTRSGQFRGADSGDPLAGKALVWARIHERTLTIYELSILEDGRYDMQTYARTLTGEGMELEYVRLQDGEPVRTVKARLVKDAN